MKELVINLCELSNTFTLIMRHDTAYFIKNELPKFIEERCKNRYLKLGNFVKRLRSGEYIPKDTYSDSETRYVYLTIGNFSGETLNLEELTFLEETVGKNYEEIQVNDGNFIITRSGTVGSVHIFKRPDEKIYIPSHHLAVMDLAEKGEADAKFLEYYLKSDFPKSYFWAFATGKSQKEISNWSIKSLPIPWCVDPSKVASRCGRIENEIKNLQNEISNLKKKFDSELWEGISQENKTSHTQFSNYPK